MASKKSHPIEFSVIEKIREKYWDDEDFREDNGVEEMFKALDLWVEEVIDQFNNFEHHPRSALFRDFGHDYADESQRFLEFPEVCSGSYNYGTSSEYDYEMKEKLREALSYRIDNGDDKKAGWRVFEKITGKYSVDIVDMEVQEDRKNKLVEFIELLHEDLKLTTIDPQTGKEAMTVVNPKDSEMAGIKYFFPLGLDDTSELHYMVLEKEQKEKSTPYAQVSISDLIENMTLNQIISRQSPAISGSVMGQIMSKRTDLKEMAKSGELVQLITLKVDELNKLYEEKGLEYVEEKYVPIEEETIEESAIIIETYKKIGVNALLKKASKNLADRLNNIRPPIGNDKGGAEWPKSSSGTYLLHLTTDPFSVITKSTGRPWGWRQESCETWDGCYRAGPVDDVKWGNCVVFIYEGEEIKDNQKNLIGRMLLRWGNAYKNQNRIGRDIGIEDQTYPKGAEWGKDVALALIKILKSEGFLDYDACKTPYSFKGYSDYKGGSGKITYEKTRLKGKGDIEDFAYDYLSVARNPLISFQQVGWVLTEAEGQQDIYGALAQNSILWAYPNPLIRFIRNLRSLDPELTKECITLMIDSPAADFNFFDYVIDHIEDYDTRYRIWKESIIPLILKHPNCPDNLHRKIGEEFETFVSSGFPAVSVGGIDEIVYLNLMGNSNHFTSDRPPHICTASTETLEKLVDKVLRGDLPHAAGRRRKYVPIDEIRFHEEFGLGSDEVDFYWIHREYLFSIRNLIFAPNLSQKSFLKLMNSFVKFLNANPNYGINYPICAILIDKIKQDFTNCVCLPLREKKDYGYIDTLPNGIYVGLGEVPVQYHYHLEERQDGESMKMLWDINPKAFSEGQSYGVLDNIRTRSALNILWRNNQTWDINPIYLLMSARNRNRAHMDEIGDYELIDGHFMWKCIEKIWEDRRPERLIKLKYQCIFNDDLRMDLPVNVTDQILDDEELTTAIGWNIVATWLQGVQFYIFESKLLKYIFRDKYDSERKIIKPLEDIWSIYDEEKWVEQQEIIDRLELLQLAACGSITQEGGLTENINLPPQMQKRLISRMEETVGIRTLQWSTISQEWGGEYFQYMNIIIQKLLFNEGVTTELLEWIVQHYPQYFEDVASNPNAPDRVIEEQMIINPIGLISNPRLSFSKLAEANTRIWEILMTVEVEDEGRLFSILTESNQLNRGKAIEIEMRKANNPDGKLNPIRETLINNQSWMRYWRGGSCKKKMHLPTSPMNVNPTESTKLEGFPAPIINKPLNLDKSQIIIDMDFDNEKFTRYVGTSEEGPTIVRIREIQKIEILENNKLHVKGRQKLSSPENRGRWHSLDEVYQDWDEMYGYIRVQFDIDMVSPQFEIGDEVVEYLSQNKWKHSLTLVIFDERKDIEGLPLWRKTWSQKHMDEYCLTLVNNSSINDDIILSTLQFMNDNEGLRINASDMYHTEARARIDPLQLLTVIDKNKRWTPLIVERILGGVLGADRNVWIGNFENLLPDSEILDLSLSADRLELRENYGEKIEGGIIFNTIRTIWDSMASLQSWILEAHGLQIPISYIYQLMTEPWINPQVKRMAIDKHRERIKEFVAYVSTLHTHVEGEGMIIEA